MHIFLKKKNFLEVYSRPQYVEYFSYSRFVYFSLFISNGKLGQTYMTLIGYIFTQIKR